MKNIWCVGEEIRSKVLADIGRCQFGEVFRQLGLRIPPCEVRVRLREAQLRDVPHQLRTSERLGKKNDPGITRVHFTDQPFPEAERLGVRGTPTLLAGVILPDRQRVRIVGKIAGAPSYAEFTRLVEMATNAR